jgi:hypothetical protein
LYVAVWENVEEDAGLNKGVGETNEGELFSGK